jgi:hypothetical protein
MWRVWRAGATDRRRRPRRVVLPVVGAEFHNRMEEKDIDNHVLRERELVDEAWRVDEAKHEFPRDVEAQRVDGHSVRLVFVALPRHENVRNRPRDTGYGGEHVRYHFGVPVGRCVSIVVGIRRPPFLQCEKTHGGVCRSDKSDADKSCLDASQMSSKLIHIKFTSPGVVVVVDFGSARGSRPVSVL